MQHNQQNITCINSLKKEVEFDKNRSIAHVTEKHHQEISFNPQTDLFWELTNTLFFKYISPSFNSITGYQPDELIDSLLLTFCHPETLTVLERTLKIQEQRHPTLSTTIFKGWFYHKNGGALCFLSYISPNINQLGELIGYSGISRKLTEPESKSEKQTESGTDKTFVAENTDHRIWSIDHSYILQSMNSNFWDSFKKAFKSELKIGYSIIDILPDSKKPIWVERYNRVLSGEQFTIIDQYAYQGIPEYFEISFSPIISENKVVGALCIAKDITDQRLIREQLKENELHFRFLADAALDMMSIDELASLYAYIPRLLHQKIGNVLVLFVLVDEDAQWTTLHSISGIDDPLLKKVIEISGFNPINRKYKLLESHNQLFRTGTLQEFNGDLAAFASTQFSGVAAKALQRILRINKIYTIGINKNNKLFAAVHFFTLNNTEIENKHFVESFINLCSVVIQRSFLVEALSKSEDKFRKFFENSFAAIAIQTEHQFFLVNKAWEKITGYNAEEAKNLLPDELIYPDAINKTNWNPPLNDNKPSESFEFHLVTKDKKEKWLDVTTSGIEYEGHKAILVIGNDNTHKKQAEIQIKKLSTAIFQSPTSIVITDKDGTIEYVNPYFTRTTGYTFEEVIGQNPKILKTEFTSKETHQNMWKTILAGDVWEGEFLNKKKDGELYWELARIAPITDEHENIISFIAIKEDITKRKRNLAIIEKSEKELRELNAQKDKFFSIIAHDLRGPFAALIGLTTLLKENFSTLPADRSQNILTNIDNSANHVYKLLENLLEWVRSQTGKTEFKPEVFNVATLVSESVVLLSLITKNKEITITEKISGSLFAYADKNMISTVVRNLVSNAIKYSMRQGTIEITASKQISDNKEYVEVSVIDHGVGIAPAMVEKIFQLQETSSTPGTEKEKGTGLGLIICKEFVEKNNGEIWCTGNLNLGCTFSFTLPVNNGKPVLSD